jgi:hypothetical protein
MKSSPKEVTGKACPFVVNRVCLIDGCMAWDEPKGCVLIPASHIEFSSPFDQKLREMAPLMYRTLLDLVGIMEETSRDCNRCGPELWNYVQEVRRSLLDELTRAQLDLKD